MFNTKVRLLLIGFMLFSSILAYPAPAWGCTCVMLRPPEEEFLRANAVFVGTVTKGSDGGDTFWVPLYIEFVQFYFQFVPPLPPMNLDGFIDRTISFEVEDSWKGVSTTRITLQTDGGMCGTHFNEGKQYIVYADEREGVLHGGICSRTTLKASATEDLDYLQTVPKLELTYIPPMLNPLMLCVGLLLAAPIVLGVVIWRKRRIKT